MSDVPAVVPSTSLSNNASVPRVASLGSLFVAFLRLGATAFGGPAMVAYMRDLAVARKGWLPEPSFQDGVAICQSIPGATAMQTAAYVGLRVRGVRGALVSYIGFGLPAFVLMLLLSGLYQHGRNLQPVMAAFRGLQVIVVALLANAALNFGRSSIKNWRDVILAAAATVLLAIRANPLLVILGGAAAGMLLYRRLPGPKAMPAPQRAQSGAKKLLPVLILLMLVLGGLGTLLVFDRRLLGLAALMLKVDSCAFGGGFASIPLMLHEVVESRHWLDAGTFMDGIALGQVTPGPIVITATFIGYQIAGLAGAVVGTLAIFSPSFIFLLLAVPHFDRLQHSPLFRAGLRGALLSFVGLLLATTFHFGAAVHWGTWPLGLAAAAFAALRWKVDVLWVVLLGTVVSVSLL